MSVSVKGTAKGIPVHPPGARKFPPWRNVVNPRITESQGMGAVREGPKVITLREAFSRHPSGQSGIPTGSPSHRKEFAASPIMKETVPPRTGSPAGVRAEKGAPPQPTGKMVNPPAAEGFWVAATLSTYQPR